MLGLIEGWIFNQLGINCNFKNIEENPIFQDGCVLVNILQSYGLVDDKFRANFHPTTKEAECKNNLKLLKPLFDMLKIKYNQAVINGIAENKAGTTINFLYELFICLENKQHLYFVTKQNFENVCRETVKDLHNVTIDKNLPKKDNILSTDCSLENPIKNNAYVIDWYRDKYKKIKNNLSAKLNQSKTPVLHKEPINTKPTCKPCLSNYASTTNSESFEDLPELNSYPKSSKNEILLDYKDFIARYKNKKNNRDVQKSIEKVIQHELLQSTWKKVQEEQNQIYSSVLSAVLLKQSNYEKQILSKLVQAQKEIHIQNENRVWANQSVINEQEQKIVTDFELKDKFEILEQNYKSEQKRVLELHNKLYKEKKEITKREHYNICKDTVDAIVELAISAAEYKLKNKMEVSKSLWYNWAQLFIKSQPIQSQLQTIVDDISAERDVDYDEAISFQKEQDEALNDIDIDNYLLTRGIWFHNGVFLEHPNFNENNLAAVVYRVLSFKYPLPPSSPAPDLPDFNTTGVLQGLNSHGSVEKLKLLLSQPGIHVFDTEMAVKKCIDQFKTETFQCPEENKSKGKKKELNNKTINSLKQQSGEREKLTKKKIGKKSEKVKSSKSVNAEQISKGTEDVLSVVNKETQTSVLCETMEEEAKRTSLGLLGEKIYYILKEGAKLDHSDIASVIVEYIRSLEAYDGWLLLNYPTTIEQAFSLELALTAKKIPLTYFISDEINLPDEELDVWSEKRKSRLLNYPLQDSDSQPFKSYFKIFIKVEAEDREVTPNANLIIEGGDFLPEREYEPERKLDAHSDLLDKFYSSLGVCKHFNLKSDDLNNLKCLARVILEEEGIEAKPSINLFGEEALSKLAKGNRSTKTVNSSMTDKKLKTKGKDKNKVKKSDFVNKSIDINQGNVTVIDTDHSVIDPEEINSEYVNLLPPEAGEHKKESYITFAPLPLNPDFGVLLATMWENIETCYITNLTNVFFENRFINLRLHPYCMYIEKEMNKVIEKPDLKQIIINAFQEYYNTISDELRTLPEMKSQLHCRVLEVQQNLWEITDERKNEVEGKRQDLIYENWLVNEICLLINNYLSLVQIEFERSLLTLQLLNDYYLNMLGKTAQIMKIPTDIQSIGRINVEMLLDTIHKLSGETAVLEIGDGSKMYRRNLIANSLVSCLDEQNTIDMFETIILEKIKDAKSNFTSILNIFYTQNKSEAIMVSKLNKEGTKLKSPTSNDQTSKKQKKEIRKNKSLAKSSQSEQEVQNILLKESVIEEWKCTINTEAERLDFRIDLIYQRAKENVIEFYCFLEAMFCKIYKSTLSRYNTAISNINSACDYLRIAIEEESPLHHQLILGQDKFIINVKGGGESMRCSTLRELKEDFHECLFTIRQLNHLLNVFKISAPLGVIRKQPLCYILQDLMLLDSCDNHPYLPKSWNSLNELQLTYVIDDIFGPEFSVDWKDFIIYNLDIPYPEVNEILQLRIQFLSFDPEETEIISLEDYEHIALWFETILPDGPEQGLRYALVKKLLSEMFKVDETHINYTALLLYFCKDFNAVFGFKKALSLSLGKNVIVTKSELGTILQNEEEINEIVGIVIRDTIDSIVITRETAQVYEIPEIPSQKYLLFSESSKDSSMGSLSHFSKFRSLDSLKTDPELHSQHTSQLDELKNSKTNIQSKSCNTKLWVTKIPITSVLSVLNASFFYQDRRFALKTQYLNCLEDEGDSDGMIEAYDLVNLTCIQKLFTMTNKFKISRPCDIVRECLDKM